MATLSPPAALKPYDLNFHPDVLPGNSAMIDSIVGAPISAKPVSANEARTVIARGNAPAGLHVKGLLSFAGDQNLTMLPEDLQVTRLNVSGCRSLRSLPAGLHCYELNLQDTPLQVLPPDLRVDYRLDLSNCTELQELPAGLKVGSLVLQGCTRLAALPEDLDVYFLDISGCSSLTAWPERAAVRIGRLNARACSGLTVLPGWLTQVTQMDLRGCTGLTSLPEGLRVSSWVDLADTSIRSLPNSMASTALRWRGVPIDARIAFHPETITAREVLATSNSELRRVLLERMGYEAFLAEAHAQVLDTDADPGGERRLLRVPLSGDEDLVCISVFCPSTGRQYIIRVPPQTRTCHKAAAWIAGYDDERVYQPIAET